MNKLAKVKKKQEKESHLKRISQKGKSWTRTSDFHCSYLSNNSHWKIKQCLHSNWNCQKKKCWNSHLWMSTIEIMHMLYTQTHIHICVYVCVCMCVCVSLKIICKLNTYYTLKAEINRITKIYFYINSFKTFMNVLWMGKDSYCSKRVLNVF